MIAPDPHDALGAALLACGGQAIRHSKQTPWASATFAGARHFYTIELPTTDCRAHYEALEEREFDLPGYIVADIFVIDHVDNAARALIDIEVLTVEDQ